MMATKRPKKYNQIILAGLRLAGNVFFGLGFQPKTAFHCLKLEENKLHGLCVGPKNLGYGDAYQIVGHQNLVETHE